MIVSFKDIYKMIGMLVVSFCAVVVCTMFLNYYLDIITIEKLITTDMAKIFYDAQCSTAKVVSILSGGCLLLTTVVLICFYIGHYIDTHEKQLGIMKALGYTRFSIAKNFWVFGISIFTGTSLGYLTAHLLMPTLYKIQNKDGYLPDFATSFHPVLCIMLVLMPTLFFSSLAIGYSYFKLRVSALALIRGQSAKKITVAKKETDMAFLQELEKKQCNTEKISRVFHNICSILFCGNDADVLQYG